MWYFCSNFSSGLILYLMNGECKKILILTKLLNDPPPLIFDYNVEDASHQCINQQSKTSCSWINNIMCVGNDMYYAQY